VFQTSKLLSLVGVGSFNLAVCAVLLLVYTLPFVLHCTSSPAGSKGGKVKAVDSESELQSLPEGGQGKYRRESVDMSDQWQFKAHPLLLLIYLLMALVASYYAYVYLAHDILEFLMLRDPGSDQQIAACVALWCGFASLLSFSFHRATATPRRSVECFTGIVLYCTVLQCTALHCTVLHCTVL
jgi:hypothetical protein